MKIAFFASSLVSAYWNGACTYYRGIVRALAERGHAVTFYEPDILDRQAHRDIPDPEWATVVVYRAEDEDDVVAREPFGELLLGRGEMPLEERVVLGKLASADMGSCQTGAASFSASMTAS